MTQNELENTYYITLGKNVYCDSHIKRYVKYRTGKVLKIYKPDFESLVKKGHLYISYTAGHGIQDSVKIKKTDIAKVEQLKLQKVNF